MTVNGLTLLLTLAAAAAAWQAYTRTTYARRRRTARLRDRVGAQIVAGYIHGLEAWLDHAHEPREPQRDRPVWHARLGLQARMSGAIELDRLAYDWARHLGWQHAERGDLPAVVPDPLASNLLGEHLDRALSPQIPTLHDELASIRRRTMGRAR